MSIDEDAVLDVVQDKYRALMRVDRDVRRSDRLIEDLGIDSLSAMEIFVTLEDTFDTTLTDGGSLESVRTVQDLIAVVVTSHAANHAG